MAHEVFKISRYYPIPGFVTDENLKEIQVRTDGRNGFICSELFRIRLGDDVKQLEFIRDQDGNYRCDKVFVNGAELVTLDDIPSDGKILEELAFALYDKHEIHEELDILPGFILRQIYTPREVQLLLARLTGNPNLVFMQTKDVFAEEEFDCVNHKNYIGVVKRLAENGEWEKGMIFSGNGTGFIYVFLCENSSCKVEWRYGNLRIDKDFSYAWAQNHSEWIGRDKIRLIRSIIEQKPQVEDDEANENFIKNYLAQEHSIEEVMQLLDRVK